MTRRPLLFTIFSLATVLVATRLVAQSPTPPDSIVVTHGQVVVRGKTIRYTTRAGMLPLLENDTGELMARMFFISYTADRAPGEPARPLTFLWNGGPGSNAAQVHVVGFGPKRIKTGDTYPWRFKIKKDHAVDPERAIKAESLLAELTHVKRWPKEHWRLAFQGNVHELDAKDFAVIEAAIAAVESQRSAA